MPFAPNTVPNYAIKPIAYKVAVPATAKTVFTDSSNAAVLIPADNDHPRTFGSVFVQPVATLTAGVLQLYLYDGTAYTLFDEAAHGAVTVSTTAAGAGIIFTRVSNGAPLILPEGWSALVATKVAQTAGSLIAHAQLGKLF